MTLTIINDKNMEHPLTSEHRDDSASRIGMWLFIFTELFLFAGLFMVFVVYRVKYSEAFHLAAKELSVTAGTINSIILLLSGMTMGMAYISIQKGKNKLTLSMLTLTILLGIIFLTVKYFEWSGKFEHGLYPGSGELIGLSKGDTMFFGLYFFMTGLHALHLIAGIVLIAVVIGAIIRGRVHSTKYALLENSSLYWHMVDLVWIFLFPLFYLIN
jgi:cytochrome c oxidase subunit 3